MKYIFTRTVISCSNLKIMVKNDHGKMNSWQNDNIGEIEFPALKVTDIDTQSFRLKWICCKRQSRKSGSS